MNSTNRSTKTSRPAIARVTLALLAAGAIGGASLAAYSGAAQAQATLAQSAAPIGTVTTPDFAQINKLYGPAVVNITVKGTEKVSDNQDNPFQQFFGQFPGFPGMPQGGSHMVPMEGVGSGFIVSPNGLIITNAHVVKNAKSVVVKLTDRREYRAKVLGSDPQTDVAVIKIDATGLPTVKLGHVSSLQVGDWVLAIGSPYGLESTATAGIVSALGRSLPDDTSVPFIQTDVPVNPGNSGGPLFNTKGEVVGINSQIFTQTGAFEGLSFAIPINVAERVAKQIIEHGKVQHARLGIAVQTVTQNLATSFGLQTPRGALVAQVEKDSPASKAGLQPGDIILSVNGQPVNDSADLPMMIGLSEPGSKVTLGVWHDHKQQTITAVLGNFSDNVTLASASPGAQGDHGGLGLVVRPLNANEEQQAGVSHGLLVEGVSGPAEQAGIQPGDILIAVDGKSVSSIDQVRGILKSAGKSVALLIQRGSNRIFVPVQVG